MRPGGAETPPEALTSATYQAAGATVAPDAGRYAESAATVVTWYAPSGLDERSADVLAVIAQAADHYGLARISERDIARRLRCGRCAVRMAKVRLERQQCINVVTGTRRPDKRLPTSTFQITVGPWADLWKPPGIARAGAQRTFDKRLDELGPRRDELEEQRARAQTRPRRISSARPVRAPRARPRKNEVLSQGGARQGRSPPRRTTTSANGSTNACSVRTSTHRHRNERPILGRSPSAPTTTERSSTSLTPEPSSRRSLVSDVAYVACIGVLALLAVSALLLGRERPSEPRDEDDW